MHYDELLVAGAVRQVPPEKFCVLRIAVMVSVLVVATFLLRLALMWFDLTLGDDCFHVHHTVI